MKHLTSPEKHIQAREIQSLIRSYKSCASMTDDGKSCRSSMATNKFADPHTGTRYDCNSYCMRKCTPKQLLHIFKNTPHEIITTENNHFEIESVHLLFEVYDKRDRRTLLAFADFTWDSHFRDWRGGAKLYGSKDVAQWIDGSADDMSQILCTWFQSVPLDEKIMVMGKTLSPGLRKEILKMKKQDLTKKK